MKRLAALLLAIPVLAGCTSAQSPPTTNPFMGRTRVPPPGTRALNSRMSDPYYRGLSKAVAEASPAWQASGAARSQPTVAKSPTIAHANGDTITVASASTRLSPAGPPAHLGERIAIPAIAGSSRVPTPNWSGPDRTRSIPIAASSVTDGSASGPATRKPSPPPSSRPTTPVPTPAQTVSSQLTGNRRPHPILAGARPKVQVIPPRPQAAPSSAPIRVPRAAVACAACEPRRFRAAGEPINIMDLPPAGSTPRAKSSTSGAHGIRQVSANGQNTSGSKVVAAVAVASEGEPGKQFTPKAGYGYDPNYAWLRGRLEYSQVDRRWKLRYIPIDGETDDYGGSVVLPDPSVLSGCERGDFIEVRGKPGEAPTDTQKGFAPVYHVTQVKRSGG